MTAETNLDTQIAEYRPRLKSFIRARVAGREDAEDILQSVLLQWMRTVNAAMNPIENLSAWLYRVARNTIINARTKKREAPMPVFRDEDDEWEPEITDILLHTAPSPETEYLRTLVWQELEAALAELPPAQRTVFELTEFDGIPVKEIAATTGTPVATLLSRKHYAVLHLRRRLSDLYNEVVYG